jgi:hypothetical protein
LIAPTSNPERERGSYLHPAVFGQAEENGVEWVHQPALMKRLKEAREKAKQPAPPAPASQPNPDSEKP